MIERLLEGGSLKYAEAFLNHKTKKNKEKQQKLQEANMNLDKQREQEAIKLKDQLMKDEEKVKTDEALRLYEGKLILDEKYKVTQHGRDMEKLGLQSSLNMVENAHQQEVAAPVQ
jgi:hypothetical protein